MLKVRMMSTGKERGEEEMADFSSSLMAICSSLLMESELLELLRLAAARVGWATCSMKSSRLGVSLMCSGKDSTTAWRDKTPRFTGRLGRPSGSSWEGRGTSWPVGAVTSF